MIVEAHTHTHTHAHSGALRPLFGIGDLSWNISPGIGTFLGTSAQVLGTFLGALRYWDLRLLRRENTHVEPRSPSPARQGPLSGIAEPFARTARVFQSSQ